MMTTLDGLRRAFGHFVLFAAPPAATGYALYKSSLSTPGWVLVVAGVAVGLYIGWSETRSTLRGVQTRGKALIDGIAKAAGAWLGLASFNWW